MDMAELAQMLDVSAVRSDSSADEVEQMCQAARRYGVIGVFCMPWCVPHLVERLADRPEIRIGSVCGFPSGGDSTRVKLFTIEELIRHGAAEIDSVLNIAALKSGLSAYIRDELRQIRSLTKGLTMKIIIEAPLLTDAETASAVALVADSGADYVKTGTGWHGACPLERVQLICAAAAGCVKVKAAGGIRSLDAIRQMRAMGVERFGVGVRALDKIMTEAAERGAAL